MEEIRKITSTEQEVKKVSGRLRELGLPSLAEIVERCMELIQHSARLQQENTRMKKLLDYIDRHAPTANASCAEPGITFTQALEREMEENCD